MDPATSLELIKWGVQQGALTFLVIIGGFFWWRESKRREEQKDATIVTLISLVNQVNSTQGSQTMAIREQAVATAQLSETLHELKDEIRAMMRIPSNMRRSVPPS